MSGLPKGFFMAEQKTHKTRQKADQSCHDVLLFSILTCIGGMRIVFRVDSGRVAKTRYS